MKFQEQISDNLISIEGAHIDLGDALPDHIRQSIKNLVSKYFNRITSASIHFKHDKLFYCCSIQIRIGSLPVFSSEHEHRNIYISFSCALEKISKQLRRRKREEREDKASRNDKASYLNSPSEPDDIENVSAF